MGREVRRVPANWKHPKDAKNNYIPLYGGSVSEKQKRWDEEEYQWRQNRLHRSYEGEWLPIEDQNLGLSYEEWDGPRPVAEDFMPDWPEDQRTHFQMYETCTEGTPISPIVETAEALADWLYQNKASFFGDQTASWAYWYGVIIGKEIGLPVFRAGEIVNCGSANDTEWPEFIND